ncbi:nose resistant to fluoxetine protein 6-like [Anthonomus grandis grandis]|uniref:nose resistant to fluoxetine protein 6-like n=1 Tax=Anthonomus grandis grandis TaxID=2921223 RepID=UPI00216672EE|nr:nose resistant to fluoxetine protein 6-like [Anthonomus grandis grandis]
MVPVNFCKFFLKTFLIFSAFVAVKCAVKESFLRAHYPLYGLSFLGLQRENASTCFMELSQLKRAVDAEKVWGLKVLDASGAPSEGFLYGNNLWIGLHMQCKDLSNTKPFEIRNDKINHTKTAWDFPPYDLAFAVVMIKHNSTVQLRMRLPLDNIAQLGLCIPKSCLEQDIFNLSNEYFKSNVLDIQNMYNLSMDVINIRMLRDDAAWLFMLPKTIILISILVTILVLTIVGTVCDVKQHNREKNLVKGHNDAIENGKKSNVYGISSIGILPPKEKPFKDNKSLCFQIVKSFSIYSNVKKWVKTKSPSGDSLPVIHGLRFWAMGWVIFVHNTFFQADFLINPPHPFRLSEDFFGQIYSNSTYCVDTYLFLSGFLLAYLFFKKVNPHEKAKHPDSCFTLLSKFVYFTVHRFLRLTPTYAIVLLICNVLYTYYSKSSALYFSERSEVICDQYWWRNLLYINNLYPRSEMCISWSWYLSADMQLFIISTFFLLLSTVYFKLTAVLVFLMIFVHVGTTAYKSYSVGYIPTLDDQLEQLDAIYDLPWNRIGPYMVGLITAYILVIRLKNKLVLKEKIRLALWVLFPLLNLWILFTLYTRQLSVEFSAFYMGVSRPLWGVGIAWFVVALSTGNARLLEKLFSFKAWVPLGRLTYCAYLLNPLVVTMIGLGAEAATLASIPYMAVSATGTLMITMLLSFVVSMLCESPFISITKIMFDRPIKSNVGLEETSEKIEGVSSHNGSTSTVDTIA